MRQVNANDIETFLSRNLRRDVSRYVSQAQRGHKLVLFGETHVGLSRKARFFADVIRVARRSGAIKFHASEHFHNNQLHGQAVHRYLTGQITASGLPSELRVFSPILDEIKRSLPGFGLVSAGTSASSNRDQRIYNHFGSNHGLHLRAGRFSSSDHGHFHLGADHAARTSCSGTQRTTCQHLIADGWGVHVIRLTVDVTGSSHSDSSGAITIVAGENIIVQPMGGSSTTDIDLLPILRRLSGSPPSAFVVDVTPSGSPFHHVRSDGCTRNVSFARRFDAILHLPG